MTEHRDYRRYNVYRRDPRPTEIGAFAGSIEAQSPEQAIYRLAGGEWGRQDFHAEEAESRP